MTADTNQQGYVEFVKYLVISLGDDMKTRKWCFVAEKTVEVGCTLVIYQFLIWLICTGITTNVYPTTEKNYRLPSHPDSRNPNLSTVTSHALLGSRIC